MVLKREQLPRRDYSSLRQNELEYADAANKASAMLKAFKISAQTPSRNSHGLLLTQAIMILLSICSLVWLERREIELTNWVSERQRFICRLEQIAATENEESTVPTRKLLSKTLLMEFKLEQPWTATWVTLCSSKAKEKTNSVKPDIKAIRA